MRFARVDTRKSWLPVRCSRYTTCLPIKPHQRDEPGTSWMHLEKPETPLGGAPPTRERLQPSPRVGVYEKFGREFGGNGYDNIVHLSLLSFPYPFSNDNSCQVESRLYHFSAGSLPSFFSLSMPRVPFSRAHQCDTVLSIHSQYGGLARRWNMEIGMFRIILGLGFGGCSNFDGYFDRRGIFRKWRIWTGSTGLGKKERKGENCRHW